MRAAFVVLTALALVPFTPAAAQQQMVPAGSYLNSCTNIAMNGPVLSASCNLPSSGTNRSSIDLRSCPGNIANINGNLTCNGANLGNGYLPQGSYLQSCRNISKRHHFISASCEGPRGGQIASSLDLRRCAPGSLVANINGYLQCGAQVAGGGWNGRLPQGSYQGSCTNVAMSGSVLSASCTAPNGQAVQSSLDTNRCQWNSGIKNTNGRLDCANYR